ncbi:MAG: hypothetical protein ACYC6X_00315 [Minisyncoccota bacterium]
MKTIFDHIEYVKGKPHHVRKQIAFTAAAMGAGLVGLVWLVGSVSLGAFAIQGTSFAESTGQAGVIATSGSDNGSSNLAGAAAALPTDANAPAHIEIIDTASSTAGQTKAEQTVIPF